ncbi:unnamed protein product [Caenorhabditis angaria]|uniref:Uncharacterized protein n=1 Tax=Caenorhabditis angaria TaxID=860376 RepID=A0A9P1J1T1_9PELO|nr:unnamed protein product [Caenorhabditis angaria]
MKLQTGISSKDLATLKEIEELKKFEMAKEVELEDEKKAEEKERKTSITDRILSESSCLRWDNCFLRPDNCCVVKVVKKIVN